VAVAGQVIWDVCVTALRCTIPSTAFARGPRHCRIEPLMICNVCERNRAASECLTAVGVDLCKTCVEDLADLILTRERFEIAKIWRIEGSSGGLAPEFLAKPEVQRRWYGQGGADNAMSAAMHAEYAQMHLRQGHREQALLEAALTLSFSPPRPTSQKALDVVLDSTMVVADSGLQRLKAALRAK
jgi:hypothetical protein